jgi:transmembrane sensor
MSHTSYNDLEVRRQRALEEAGAWLVRLQDATPTSTDRSAFTDWLRESPLHVGAMLRVSHTDSTLTIFDGWEDVPQAAGPFNDTVIEYPTAGDRRHAPSRPGSSSSSRTRSLLFGAAAAALLVCISVALWSVGVIGGPILSTANGERRDVELQDGSAVRLGPETRLRVRISGQERNLTLDRGEAVFKVAKDSTRPFIVTAGRIRVRALGTEFGVEKRTTGLIVTVAEGRVAVDESHLQLAAGDQVAVAPTGAPSAVRKVNSADSLAWANGRLVFDNDSVSEVVERFNQYNRIRLEVPDPRVAQRRLSGSFDATDLESFLAFLQSSMPVAVTRRDHGERVLITAPVSAPVQDP